MMLLKRKKIVKIMTIQKKNDVDSLYGVPDPPEDKDGVTGWSH